MTPQQAGGTQAHRQGAQHKVGSTDPSSASHELVMPPSVKHDRSRGRRTPRNSLPPEKFVALWIESMADLPKDGLQRCSIRGSMMIWGVSSINVCSLNRDKGNRMVG